MKKFFSFFCVMFIFLVGCSADVSQIPNMPKETNMPDVRNENAHKAYKLAMEKANNNIYSLTK